jgi:hypothetical protein
LRRRFNQDMGKMTIIRRAETTCVKRNWREGAGGRVLTFDMMLELPHSPKVAALGRNSEIVFEDKLYVVNHREVVREASTEMVRLALNRTGYAAEVQGVRSRQHGLPASIMPRRRPAQASPR